MWEQDKGRATVLHIRDYSDDLLSALNDLQRATTQVSAEPGSTKSDSYFAAINQSSRDKIEYSIRRLINRYVPSRETLQFQTRNCRLFPRALRIAYAFEVRRDRTN